MFLPGVLSMLDREDNFFALGSFQFRHITGPSSKNNDVRMLSFKWDIFIKTLPSGCKTKKENMEEEPERI